MKEVQEANCLPAVATALQGGLGFCWELKGFVIRVRHETQARRGFPVPHKKVMKFIINDITDNPVNLLRRAGYTFQRKDGEETSFIRPLATTGYPRFHMYTKLRGENLEVSFHLDHKKETYGEDTRHHGEYEESGILKQEADRIRSFLTPLPEDSGFSPV